MWTHVIRQRDDWFAVAVRRLPHGLCLAATPTFAVLALLTSAPDGAQDLVCVAAGVAPLGRMGWMYLLMSAFHSPPWLRLMAGRRGAADGG